jgi:hypothetical protein
VLCAFSSSFVKLTLTCKIATTASEVACAPIARELIFKAFTVIGYTSVAQVIPVGINLMYFY